MHILLIDDDEQCRAAVRMMLQAMGHHVTEAGGGEEGLRALRSQRADLVLCDLFMPRANGLQVIPALRRQFPGVRVVAISGGLDELDIAPLFGADALLAKPFDMAALRGALETTAAV